MLTVTLSAKGFGKSEQEVANIQEAQAAWNKFRDENFFGASDLLKSSGILKKDGKVIGHISYNGRAWDRDGKEL